MNAFAQSGRVGPQDPATPSAAAVGAMADLPVKTLFDDANTYSKTKFTEFEEKKIPFSDNLLNQTQREQKQLAAKYAALVLTRTNLAGDDYYYLGLLHWIAENLDGAAESFGKYLALELIDPDKAQASRSLIVVILAKQNKLEPSEKMLAEYQKNTPVKLKERSRMEEELAKAYQANENYVKASEHASEGFKALKGQVADAASRAKILDELLDAGMLVFEANRDAGDHKQADAALDDMRKLAAELGSPSFFYYAADKKITYMIETGRKQQALDFYLAALISAGKDLSIDSQRRDAIMRLKKREKHYNLLGTQAPELQDIYASFPSERLTLSGLKGKVVMLDFWATWCGPCFKAFPSLIDWQQEYRKDGLVILGISRLEGRVEGEPASTPVEIEFLKKFRINQKLPYDFLAAKEITNQITYGVTGLPTTVLIDRKGVIRYIETGTNTSRLAEMHRFIQKLLAEK